MSIPLRREANPLFGKVTLSAANNGVADWIRGSTSPLDQKGSTGWLARLYGGVQTNDDWARVNVPVDEIFVSDFHTANWSWYQTDTQTMGLGIVIWVHDPNDFDNRAEITQLGGHGDLPKTSGWNAFSFSSATEGMFFYGEGTTGTGLTAGTQYAWSAFQADVLFKNWTIYRITLDWGWEASGTFNYVYVADVKLNGVALQLRPNDSLVDSDGHSQVDILSITAGTNVIGKVRLVDSGGTEVTEATGHSVQAKLIAGTALAGKFGIDQATANANEVVVKSITAGDTNIGNVDIVTFPSGNLDQRSKTASLSVVPASDVPDATYVGDIKFGEALPTGTNTIGKVGHDKSSVADGVVTVTTPLTDVPLVGSSTPAKVVIIQAQTDNTGAIAVGGEGVVATIATGTGIILYAGDSITLEVDDLADVWIDALVAGEGVRFTYLT